MDDGLKQRLVGALVILALGLIFLPTLFAPEHGRQIDRSTQIPPAPVFKAKPIEAPTPVKKTAKAKSETYQLLPEESDDKIKAKASTKVSEAKPSLVPEAWVVQVASFSQEASAIDMRDNLMEQGIESFTRTHKTSKGVVTRVFAGPKISLQSAKNLKAKLDKSLEVESIVVSFAP